MKGGEQNEGGICSAVVEKLPAAKLVVTLVCRHWHVKDIQKQIAEYFQRQGLNNANDKNLLGSEMNLIVKLLAGRKYKKIGKEVEKSWLVLK